MAEAVRLFRNLLRHDYKDFPTSTAWSNRSRIVTFQRHTAGKIDRHCDYAVGMFRAQYSLARPEIMMEIICCFLQPVTLIGGYSDFPVTYPDWDISWLSQSVIDWVISWCPSVSFPHWAVSFSHLAWQKFCYFSISYPDWEISSYSSIIIINKLRDLFQSAAWV